MTDAYANLRAIPIETFLDHIQAVTDPNPSTPKSTYYHTDLGKLQVTPTQGGQLFHFWSGALAGQGGKGAIDFVITTGLVRDWKEASDYLQPYLGQTPPRPVPLVEQAHPAGTTKKPYTAPKPVFNAAENQRVLQVYLHGQRKIPSDVIRELSQGPHAPIRAGYGNVYGHYIVFPMCDHTNPRKPEVGAILRWKDAGPPTLYGGKKGPKAAGTDSSKGWWQVGPYPAPTLIVVEAPIDALSLWAALKPEDRTTTRILATGGSDVPKAPGVWAGVERLIFAQDRDAVGEDQARDCTAAAQAAGVTGPTERLTPPVGTKDWNEVWSIAPDVARTAVGRVLRAQEYTLSR